MAGGTAQYGRMRTMRFHMPKNSYIDLSEIYIMPGPAMFGGQYEAIPKPTI